MTDARIIAIDGPAAAGKGTLARRLAAHYGLPYLDTGLLYRAVARKLLDEGGHVSPPEPAIALARRLRPEELQRTDLRTPAVDQTAAAVAAIPGVRAALLDFQRGFGAAHGAVLDGRDIGTVIFPQAGAKFFVTASVQARAHRRWLELQARGLAIPERQVQDDMQARDAADASRAAAPLLPAADAIVLDTTLLDAHAALAAAIAQLEKRGWQHVPAQG